jgi:hypothetical protein
MLLRSRQLLACLAACAILGGLAAVRTAHAEAAPAPPSAQSAASAPDEELLTLPGGLVLSPGDGLDLTYQVVDSYDKTRKVLASWAGERLQYVIDVDRMPPDSPAAEEYFEGLKRDLAALSASPLRAAEAGGYAALGESRGSYLQVYWTPRGAPKEIVQVVHVIADRRIAFMAIATPVAAVPAAQLLSESVRLFSTASIAPDAPAAYAPPVSQETPYAGRWTSNEALPDGRPWTAVLELKPDLTFLTEVSVDGRRLLAASGVWSVDGSTLQTTYGRSEPPLPDESMVDADDIAGFDGTSLTLVNRRTGWRHTFVRSP